ncbi:ABC transporter ATP-binding protein [Thermofilum pendens]|uniref:ABC transporter related n=1 Tax=Thermofilum pendens (strain DSM 2475 / Hrk 5) TaxID=368408 RepID=A1S171_THEPD|nr:ABC transporter ATP-binding protein [Thermofilum pendens]ABL79201.1 ABC transporter related [Thermofilum pendens Hrk 5]
MTRITLKGVTKVYGAVKAVDNVNLEINDGELFTILGPSGCGKTTTLRIIAGFEVPDEGRVYFDDEDVTFLKPYMRETAMVFQNYALWPHMTVFENVAYGLRIRKKQLRLTDEEIERRVKEALSLVRLEGLEDRYPLQLSGGQQQRVALARALVVQPKVLLLDEPLSNLDAKLRIEMREEIKRIQKSLGITTVYVTHDQLEAMSISDKIAVMDKGRVLQYGHPREVYFRPTNLFTAEFLGRSNIYKGEVVERGEGYVVVRVEELGIDVKAVPVAENLVGKVAVVVRPEVFTVGGQRGEPNTVKGTVDFVMFLGDRTEVRLKVGKASLIAYLPNTYYPQVGEELELSAPWRNVIAIPV